MTIIGGSELAFNPVRLPATLATSPYQRIDPRKSSDNLACRSVGLPEGRPPYYSSFRGYEPHVSRSVLGQLSEPAVAIEGVHWLSLGERKTVGINNLTANILCGHHNSALSILDTEAGLFLSKIKNIHVGLGRKSLSRKRSISIVSGDALELWILKMACGLFYSKIASHDRQQIAHDHKKLYVGIRVWIIGLEFAVIFRPARC